MTDASTTAQARVPVARTPSARTSRRSSARAQTASRWRTSTAPAARRCRGDVVEAMTGLPAAPQREHALGLSHERRDGRRDRAARAALADFLNARARRDRVRPEHDDAHVPPGARARPRAGARATRSSSRSSTTTPTSLPGARWRASAASRCASVRMHPETGQLDWADLERSISTRTEAGGDRRGVQRARHDQRRRRALRGSRTPPARSPSSTPCTMRRTSSSTCAPSAAISWPARRTSSTARTSAFCTARSELLERSTCRKLEPAPDTAPERLETGTQNHEGIVGAAAAVDFLASLGAGATRRARARVACSMSCTRAATALVDATVEWPHGDPRRRACYGPPPAAPRTPTVSFVVAGHSSTDVARRLADRALYASRTATSTPPR